MNLFLNERVVSRLNFRRTLLRLSSSVSPPAPTPPRPFETLTYPLENWVVKVVCVASPISDTERELASIIGVENSTLSSKKLRGKYVSMTFTIKKVASSEQLYQLYDALAKSARVKLVL